MLIYTYVDQSKCNEDLEAGEDNSVQWHQNMVIEKVGFKYDIVNNY